MSPTSRAGVDPRRADEYAALIARDRHFKQVELSVIHAMVESAVERRLTRGQMLFREGDPSRWDDALMTEMLTRYPGILLAMTHLLAEQNKALLRRLGEIATLPIEQRVARAVLRLAQSSAPGAAQNLHMSRQDLAEYSGTTLYTVSRLISGWTRRRLVRSGRMRLVITYPVRLSAIATRPHQRPRVGARRAAGRSGGSPS